MANNPYNELLYLKQQYEGAGSNTGLQNWASNQAKQYYSQLDPNEAQKIQGMNASQLQQYNQTRSQPQQQQQPSNGYQNATIQDLQNKFGFNYSREYAARQAEAEAQAKRDAANQGKRAVDMNVESAAQSLDHNYFQQYMQQAQGQVNSGLNAGIAADQDLRLAMSRQNALGDVYRDANLEHARLQDMLGRVELERLAREDSLFNERLQEGFQNTLAYNNQNWGQHMDDRNFGLAERQFAESQRQFDVGMDWQRHLFDNVSASDQQQLLLAQQRLQEEQRQFNTTMDWRRYEFSNMSAADQARLAQNAQQFGEEMAWRMHEAELMMKYRYDNMAFDAGYSGNPSSGGGGNPNATPRGDAFNAQYGEAARNIQGILDRYSFNSANERGVVQNSLAHALDWTNKKTTYTWGGGRTEKDIAAGKFDCSSFTQHIFKQQGISIGSTTRQQQNAGTKIAASDMRPGDLIFFDTNQQNGHVGIYLGDGQWIGAQSSTGVAVASLDNAYWKARFNGHVRRVV